MTPLLAVCTVSGAVLGLERDRCYGDFKEMAIREAHLKDGIEAVAIVTPNHVHYPQRARS